MELKLQYPFITAAGQQVDTVAVRRLKVRDLKVIGEQSGGNEVLLELNGVARMCGLVPEDLDEMDAADYQVVKARFLAFVGVTGQPVGGTESAGAVVPVSAE
ncbi:tail assembly chaperone E/41/14-like protein [Microvirgula sp. AG722]|uniref:phage tail assembly protein n=1 Tax=Microvirgula sp. AG722 TaxID=2183901 RepID=UPI000DC525D4|nr:phage tail assembly protein [Microvirgula sp. AG722]RAS18939.1 tail assembly chaperone E/41/14-like protein [Microvirgula sp. AG722]